MTRDVQITLRTPNFTYDSYGQPVEAWTTTVVWAKEQSVTRAEFYAANAAGIAVTRQFEMLASEYSGQRNILADGAEFDLVRSYQKGLDQIVLYVNDKKVK